MVLCSTAWALGGAQHGQPAAGEGGRAGCADMVIRIDAGSMCSSGFSCDSAYQVTYIVRGSGRLGIDGKRVLETRDEGRCLFIVPRFFVVSMIADDTG